MAVNFEEILATLQNKISILAKTTVSNYVQQAEKDGGTLLSSIKNDLNRWTQLFESGSITNKELETLVLTDKDLTEMTALKEAGLAAARIDQFKGSLYNLIIDTILNIV